MMNWVPAMARGPTEQSQRPNRGQTLPNWVCETWSVDWFSNPGFLTESPGVKIPVAKSAARWLLTWKIKEMRWECGAISARPCPPATRSRSRAASGRNPQHSGPHPRPTTRAARPRRTPFTALATLVLDFLGTHPHSHDTQTIPQA